MRSGFLGPRLAKALGHLGTRTRGPGLSASLTSKQASVLNSPAPRPPPPPGQMALQGPSARRCCLGRVGLPPGRRELTGCCASSCRCRAAASAWIPFSLLPPLTRTLQGSDACVPTSSVGPSLFLPPLHSARHHAQFPAVHSLHPRRPWSARPPAALGAGAAWSAHVPAACTAGCGETDCPAPHLRPGWSVAQLRECAGQRAAGRGRVLPHRDSVSHKKLMATKPHMRGFCSRDPVCDAVYARSLKPVPRVVVRVSLCVSCAWPWRGTPGERKWSGTRRPGAVLSGSVLRPGSTQRLGSARPCRTS